MQQNNVFKIVSLIDNSLIELDRFDSEKDDISDFVPLSSYYYETFELCISRISKFGRNYERIIDIVDKFKTNIITPIYNCPKRC